MEHEPIHSGHFMTSNPHTEPAADDEDEDVEVDVVEDDDKPEDGGGTSSKKAALDEKPITFYKFGPKKTQSIAIDVSLNKLNKCIKVAYNKMTTPKWKDFKGLRLHWKQRIRLNNVIWRAYYIEFGHNRKKIKVKRTPFCYFAVPDDDTTHAKLEGSILEGMYWKRRMEAVCAQYKRWRHFTKTRRAHDKPDTRLKRKRHDSEGSKLDRSEPLCKIQRSQTPKNTSTEYFDEDDFENVFTDSLFDSLNQPYMFPNPREIMQSGNADIMQPGLLSLQPSLEEIMASLEEPQSSHTRNSPFPQHAQSLRSPSPPSTSAISRHPNTSTSSSMMRIPPTVQSGSRPAQDYDVANMLVDYSNQSSSVPMPTRQSSSITSQMLMLSAQGVQPQYSQAPYDHRNWKPTSFLIDTTTTNQQLDYIPQFLQSHAGLLPGSQAMPTTPARPWWLDSPVGQSPLSSTSVGPSTPLGLSIGHDTSKMVNTPLSRLEQPGTSIFPTKTEQHHIFIKQDEKCFPPTTIKDWPRPSTTYSMSNNQTSSLSSLNDTRNSDTTTNWKLANLEPSTPIYPTYVTTMTHGRPTTENDCRPNGLRPQDLRNLNTVLNDNLMAASAGPSKSEISPVFKEEPMTGPSSVKPARGARQQAPADSTLHPEERKRILHLHAEQNRRSALKDGFDQLMEMIPDLYSGGVKPTNAVVLAKSAEYIRKLNATKGSQQEVKTSLEEKIAKLNLRISSLQSNLPSSSGVSSSSKLDPKSAMEGFYDRYTKERSKKDWRFWIMSKMLHPVAVGQSNSFAAIMSQDNASKEELAASCSDWLNKTWRGPELRPLASTLLVHLATNTNVLTSPESLGDYVREQMKNPV